jgi:PEGA domain
MMKAHRVKIAVAAMILGCCATGQAKKHSQKEDPLARKTFNAPIDSVYAAAAAVAARQWQVTSSDKAAHSLSFETTNTKLETAGGYSTYRVAVTCMATPAGGTEVHLEVVEHKVDQPSLMALMNKSERRKNMLQDFWDGIDAALKESAPAAAPANGAASAPAPPTAAPPAPPASAPAPPVPPAPAASPAAPEPRPIQASKAPQPSAAGELAVVTINSTPEGADITVDGRFIGDTPSTARLPSGDRVISIEKAGYKPWKRTVTLTEGGTVTLDATLESSE